MAKTIRDLKKSFVYIAAFYVPLFLAGYVLFSMSILHGRNLIIATAIIFFGNLLIAVFTQVSNYIIEKYSIADRTRDFLYINFADSFYRCGAGIAEMILYVMFFSLRLE